MGKSRWLARGVSRTLLLLLVALVAAIAVPGGQAGAAKKAPPGDPPGNNGTVKIKQDDPAEDNTMDHSNEPHGTECRLWLAFFGFDDGQTGDIIFTAQPPTAAKDTPVDSYPDEDISPDAAGGGQDPEPAFVPVNLAAKVHSNPDLKPHDKHGYHLKLTVIVKDKDGNEVPGAKKHKVFWMAPCPGSTPPASAAASTLRIAKAQEGAGQGPYTFDLTCDHAPLNQTFKLKAGEKLEIADVPPGTTCVVTETDKKGAESTTITEDPPFGQANDGTVKTVADKSTIVTFKNKFQGTEVVAAPPNEDIRPPAGTPAGTGGNPGASVLGATETAPEAAATLPRTGSGPGPLTATGLSALAAGAALLAGGRRRRG